MLQRTAAFTACKHTHACAPQYPAPWDGHTIRGRTKQEVAGGIGRFHSSSPHSLLALVPGSRLHGHRITSTNGSGSRRRMMQEWVASTTMSLKLQNHCSWLYMRLRRFWDIKATPGRRLLAYEVGVFRSTVSRLRLLYFGP